MGREADEVRFFGLLVEQEMQKVAENVKIAEIFEECGHSISLEQPARLANLLTEFLSHD